MTKPIVLTIAGHDPSGGAGVQADIEAIGALGCRAVSVVTCLTVQDTTSVYRSVAVTRSLVTAQLQRIFSDLPVAAVKIGLLGPTAMVDTIAETLASHPSLPVVLDPVLASGDGTPLADSAFREALLERLFPHLTLATPNSLEARALSGKEDLAGCARALLGCGADNLLITGGHEPGGKVVNRLYTADGSYSEHNSPRLEGEYHGSGCTLSAAIAAGLAQGREIREAVAQAQAYTWQTLSHGEQPGHGQSLPDRLFACNPWTDPR